MAGSKKCIPGCDCWRHTPERRARLSEALIGRRMPKCEPGCTCKKHVKACKPGCACSRHKKHPPGCTCNAHGLKGETARKAAATQRRRWAGMSDEERYACGARVSEAMAERGLSTRSDRKRTYNRHHARVNTRRGSAKEQSCAECAKPAEQWAQIHGTDGSDPMSHYKPMCRPCHADYDREVKGAKISAAKTGHEVSEEAKAKMRAAKLGKKLSPEHVAKILETKARRRREREGGEAA